MTDGKNLLMVVGDYVEDWEVIVPFQALQIVGHGVDAVCPGEPADGQVSTAVHDETGEQTYSEKPGHTFDLTAAFDEVDPADYDGLVLPGGRAPEYLRTDDDVLEVVRHFFEQEKPVAALCHAPQILVSADVLDGRTCTSFPGVADDVEVAGAEWVDEVTVDGNLVSGRNFDDHVEWLREFLDVVGTEIEHGPVAAD